MEISEELYRELILDHYKSPRNHGKLESADLVVSGANPLCGDELEFSMSFKNGLLTDLRFQGKGCSISQASASMMSEAVKNKSLNEIQDLIRQFREMMLENRSVESLSPEMEELLSLEGVKKYPIRIKCALLAWNTLTEAVKKYTNGVGYGTSD